MTECVELEIGIRRDGDHYSIELRSSLPGRDTEVRSGDSLVQFDVVELLEHSLDVAGYGRYLSERLFAGSQDDQGESLSAREQTPEMIFNEARSLAQDRGIPLRVRLFIGPNAPELHNLCWERLCDPTDENPLLTDENVPFSRYLSSLDWGHVHLRRKTALRALVVVANPDLVRYPHLAPVDVPGELDRIGPSLEGISVTVLASEGAAGFSPEGKATPANIRTHLRDGYDILYLVCHGTLEGDEPTLWLEKEEGGVHLVSGSKMVSDLRDLPVLPRLVVLASCQGAGLELETHASHQRALSALGPRLAEACIPAVIAMQGNVAMQTVTEFMPTFFRELQRDGQIDRAVAAARSHVRDVLPESDWWRPALFMRLKSGRIWYTPGFTGDQHEVETWPALLDSIRHEYCTPILGPGLTDSLFGSRREIARHWAETFQFPMAGQGREDLSQVAQYLAVHMRYRVVWNKLEEHLFEELLKRHGKELRVHYGDNLPQQLPELTRAVGVHCPESDTWKLYQVLAELPFSIYITTDPSNLLESALTRVYGEEPQRGLCPWNDYIIRLQRGGFKTAPSPERPLVYYLFGRLEEPRSLVLTEDDYYDFLIGVTRNKELIPPVVRYALADNSLLFLGFRVEERSFRVLFRSIMSQEWRGRRGRRGSGDPRDEVSSVAAQVYHEGGDMQEPERARRYLEKYFQEADINIYWGSVEDFVQELHRRWA